MTTRTAETGVTTPLPRQPHLTRIHYVLIAIVAAGATLIAGIGFAGSYTAVRELAEAKGFGQFALVFPLGIDAGIVVLLALDLLLTWMRIPFPLLRQTAWLLTAATIAFNGAAAWPDPLGVGMHAVIPVLFVVTVEAARHAVGRIADITADRHMEGVRITRWLLAPYPTARLWRRMKLWEIRSYREAVQQEQHRLVYQVHLRSRYGRGWRRRADVQELLPLRLTQFGIPLAQTAPQVLQSIGFAPGNQLDAPRAVPAATVPAQAAASRSAVATPAHGPTSAAGNSAGLGESEVQQSGAGEESLPAESNGAVAGRAPAVPPSGDRSAAGPVADAPVPRAHGAAPATYAEALDAYVSVYGVQPNARQYGRFLQEAFGMADPATGGPLPEAQLRLILRELRRPEAGESGGAEGGAGPEGPGRHAARGVAAPLAGPARTVADRNGAGAVASVMADGRPATADTAIGHSPGEAAHAASGSRSAESQRASVSSPRGDYGVITQPSVSRADGEGRGSAYASGHLAASRRSSSTGGDYAVITQPSTTSVTGGGDRSSGGFTGALPAGEYAAATARVLDLEGEGPALSAEQERFLAVAAWLEESEETGTKLSGAEVARRLGVSPRTGQRMLKKAVQTREEQLRQNAGPRGRLRSVSPRD